MSKYFFSEIKVELSHRTAAVDGFGRLAMTKICDDNDNDAFRPIGRMDGLL
jgi:hypothetical protein